MAKGYELTIQEKSQLVDKYMGGKFNCIIKYLNTISRPQLLHWPILVSVCMNFYYISTPHLPSQLLQRRKSEYIYDGRDWEEKLGFMAPFMGSPSLLESIYSTFILVHSLPYVKGSNAVREDLTLASGADDSQIWKWQQVHSATDQNQVLLSAITDSLIFNVQLHE